MPGAGVWTCRAGSAEDEGTGAIPARGPGSGLSKRSLPGGQCFSVLALFYLTFEIIGFSYYFFIFLHFNINQKNPEMGFSKDGWKQVG